MFWIPLYFVAVLIASFYGTKFIPTPTIEASKSYIAGFLPFVKKDDAVIKDYVVKFSCIHQYIDENKYISKAVDFILHYFTIAKEFVVPHYNETVYPFASKYILVPGKALYDDLRLYFDLYILPKLVAGVTSVKDYVYPSIEKSIKVISFYLEPVVSYLNPLKEYATVYFEKVLAFTYTLREKFISQVYHPYSENIATLVEPIVKRYKENVTPILEAHWDEISLVLLFAGVFTVVSIFRVALTKFTKATLKEIHDTQVGVKSMYNDPKNDALFGKDKYEVMKDESGGLNDGMAEQEARNRTQSQQEDQKVQTGSKQKNHTTTFNGEKSHRNQQQWQLQEEQQEMNDKRSSQLDLHREELLSFDNSTSSYGFDDTTPEMDYTEDKLVIGNQVYEVTDDILSEGLDSNAMPTIRISKSQDTQYHKRDFTDVSLSNPLYSISSEGSMTEDDYKSEAEKRIQLAKKAEEILNSEILRPSHSVKRVPYLLPKFPLPSSAPTTTINQENIYTLPRLPSNSSLQCLSDISMSQMSLSGGIPPPGSSH